MNMRHFLLMCAVLLVLAVAPEPASAQSVPSSDPVINDAVPLRAPQSMPDTPKAFQRDGDNLRSPQQIEAFQRRQEALKQRLAGKGQGKIQQIAKGQYVELGLERTDKIFVIIVEYGDKPSSDTRLSAVPGPLHNQIPKPDRNTDNNTAWQADYGSQHYRDLYNVQMADYYQNQSSGRYTVNGSVTEWVKVPFNGARYGNNNYIGDPGTWTLIADAINIWTQDRLNEGMTLDEIKAYLKTFDTWDRYDYDNDGDFNEPDGYIDHFQIVHAGIGEEAGGGTLGDDAIWSHRWFAFYNFRGVTGPSYNKNGGLEFGGGWGSNPNGGVYRSTYAYVLGYNTSNPNAANVTNAYPVNHTGIWVGDYTVQPENGGLGVFAHEYGHDLGLPDHYDTSGGGNNSIAFWNIMAQGSWLGDGGVDIGTKPDDMLAWDKFQLGWLNYAVTYPGKNSTHRLGPAETNTKAVQGLFVILPPEKNVRSLTDPRYPVFGTGAWWGGEGDNADNTLTRTVVVPAGNPALQMQVQYAIESDWDYAYVSVSTDNGATWVNLAGTYLSGSNWVALTTTSNPNGNNLGNGITGATSGWRQAKFDMTPYAGQTVQLRFRYKTDEFTYLRGFLVDNIVLGDFTDGAEAGNNGWTANGFSISGGSALSNQPHFYLAEYRQYRGYDTTLQSGPYTFGYAFLPNKVAHFAYQDGLLVTYWDLDQSDDNTSQHYGEGRSLPVDAHPDPLLRYVQYPNVNPFYSPWGSTVQSYDSTFGLQPTDAISLPYYGRSGDVYYQFYDYQPSLPAVPVFNDMNSYWSPVTPTASVIVPKTGTVLRVVNTNTQGSFMEVHVEQEP